jgi:negative regulator of sigma E activity
MNTREQLSCFMDGELSIDDQLMLSRAVLSDAELHESWARYQHVRQSLQHEVALDASGVAARVQQTLVSEPTVFAPMASKSQRTTYHRWRKAFAASVALLMIGIAPLWMSTQDVQPGLLPGAQVVSLEQQKPQLPPAYLNRYLSEHHAYLGASHVTQPNVRSSLMTVRYVQ